MSDDPSIQTWDILRELGFVPDSSVWSDIQPGLSVDYGGCKLSASAFLNMAYQEMVLITGVLATPRRLAEVRFEMPGCVSSREQCLAWLVWNLDRDASGVFLPTSPLAWLEIGRANTALLPWIARKLAYEGRSRCIVDREWARPVFKKLRISLPSLTDESDVWFSFDGEVLKIRYEGECIPVAATGKEWTGSYGIKAGELKYLPGSLQQAQVEFSFWEGIFTIAHRIYKEVVFQENLK